MNIFNWHEQEEYKSICRSLTNKKIISYSDWIIDVKYFHDETSSKIKAGYCIWAKPLLFIMTKNHTVEKIVSYPAHWLIEDIKYKKGINQKRHFRGFFIRHFIFNPFSYFLANFKSPKHSKTGKELVLYTCFK